MSRREREKSQMFRWLRAWSCLPQDKIQVWIKRTPETILEIISFEGGNEYIESSRRRRIVKYAVTWNGFKLITILSFL
jgi:hypothetical protein